MTAYTQQSLHERRSSGVEIGRDVEQISVDALVIRASAVTDNHICSVSSEHNLHVYIARFAAVYCIVIGPVCMFVGLLPGAYAGGADGAEAPPPGNAEHFSGLLMSERLCMSYEVPYTLALVAETGQSQVYIRGNK